MTNPTSHLPTESALHGDQVISRSGDKGMDRFKFRAWDIAMKEMIYFDRGNTHDTFVFYKGYATYYNLQNGSGGDEYILNQCTGLKDNNGKLVYEGDALSGDYPCPLIVEFINAEFKVRKLENVSLWLNNGSTIIGNVFENPELLTK